MWKVQRIVKKGEYLYAVVPEHPHAIKFGYVAKTFMKNHRDTVKTTGE